MRGRSCRCSGRRRRCSRSARNRRACTVPTGTPMLSGNATEVRLVAHVRAVGQVVVAVEPREQRVHVRPPARRGPRCRTPPPSDRAPSARAPISAKASAQATGTYLSVAASHRIGCGEPALLLEVVVGPGPSSLTVCCAKNSGVTALAVISQAVAFAPFSQNSKTCGSAGLAQAQLTHMKPSGLFCCISTRVPLTATSSWVRIVFSDLPIPSHRPGPRRDAGRSCRRGSCRELPADRQVAVPAVRRRRPCR